MTSFKETPSQTAGPYVHIGCVPRFAGLQGLYNEVDLGAQMITGPVDHPSIDLSLRIFDGAGDALCDAMVELWQPGPDGGFGTLDQFRNWGRQATDFETGLVRFTTLKPGSTGDQAPHILLWIVARGINIGLTTRIYFDDETELNATDPVFRLAGERAQTMVAQKTNRGYHHDIFLQGDQETVFFDV